MPQSLGGAAGPDNLGPTLGALSSCGHLNRNAGDVARHAAGYTSAMHTRFLPILAATLLLSACGNKADLLQPRQVPPEDRGRYIFKSSIPTQEQLDAEEEAAWEDDADEEATDDTIDDATGTPPAQPVPLILDVPPATTGTP